MVPQWIGTVIEFGYFAALVLSLVFIGIILARRLVLATPSRRTRALSREARSVGDALHNPALMWATIDLDTDVGCRRIPFPIFRWWLFEESEIMETRAALQRRFLEDFAPYIEGARIYTASHPAYYFLKEIEVELQDKQASVVLLDPHHPLPPARRRVALFDTSVATGHTLRLTAQRLPQDELRPSTILLLIWNDLVPPHYQGEPWAELGAKLKYLYTASQLVTEWPEGRQHLALALLTLREVYHGNLGWQDDRVDVALKTLYEALVAPPLPA